MEYKVTIDEKVIEELLQKELLNEITRLATRQSSFRYDMKDAIGKAIKEYIYENKEKIIEMVVDRASKEIVKKGLPKLLEKL